MKVHSKSDFSLEVPSLYVKKTEQNVLFLYIKKEKGWEGKRENQM